MISHTPYRSQITKRIAKYGKNGTERKILRIRLFGTALVDFYTIK